MITKKKKLTESPIKTQVRKLIMEGELEKSESVLATKDFVDRLQDMVKELGKMSNDELPQLIDAIRAAFTPEAATAYQQTANTVFTDLLDQVKNKKTELETATLELTGDATGADALNLGDDIGAEQSMGGEDELPALDAPPSGGGKPKKMEPSLSPLGREPRMPTEETRRYNKRVLEAKIMAINKALQETDSRRFPKKARNLSEELGSLVTIAIKEEAKAKLKSKAKAKAKAKTTSKTKELPAFLKTAAKKKVAKKPTKK